MFGVYHRTKRHDLLGNATSEVTVGRSQALGDDNLVSWARIPGKTQD